MMNSPWDMMQQQPMEMPQQMQGIPQGLPPQMMGMEPQAPQQQMTVYDYPGVREALQIPEPQIPAQAEMNTPEKPEMASPWDDMMGAGYGQYL